MSFRIPMLVALAVVFAAPAIARSQTTDEARALAGKNLPAAEAPKPVPPGTFPQSTDDARALAGRMLPRSERAPAREISAISTTDEARAVAGGLLVIVHPVSMAVTDNGFVPSRVKASKGEKVRLVVTRTTDSTCAKEIVIKEEGINQALPLNKAVTVEFTPTKAGEIRYACGMDHVSGVVFVN